MGKGTTVKEAIKLFGERYGVNPVEAKHVKLYFQCPPIEKMDATLSTLTACEHLSLSSNNIDRIAGLANLPNLKILSLGRNNISKLDGLEGVAETLQELWVSYNGIERLSGVLCCKHLRVLYIGNNMVSSWAEIERLAQLPCLEELFALGNPLCASLPDDQWRVQVVRRLPGLRKLDGLPVTDKDRGGV